MDVICSSGQNYTFSNVVLKVSLFCGDQHGWLFLQGCVQGCIMLEINGLNQNLLDWFIL